MKTSLITLFLTLTSFPVWACPQLAGEYAHCETKASSQAEIVITEYVKSGTRYYDIKKVNGDADDELQNETLRTDGEKVSRKIKVPKYGVTLRIDTRSQCAGDVVVARSEVFSLGIKVGEFTTKFYKQDNILHTVVDGGYLNREVKKHAQCIQI